MIVAHCKPNEVMMYITISSLYINPDGTKTFGSFLYPGALQSLN